MKPLEKWSESHKALVRLMPTCREMPQNDFDVFWARCCLSELDPLLDQAMPVARSAKTNEPERNRDGSVKKETGSNGREYTVYKRTTVYTFQATEAGMLARAERMPDFLGLDACAVFKEDEIRMDRAAGEVRHVFNPAQRKGALIGAWARLERKGKRPVVVWLDFAAVSQGGDFWSKMPAVMVEKCARVAAVRKAYPEAFGGWYIPEEMPREEETESSSPLGQVRKPTLPSPEPRPAPSSPPAAGLPMEERQWTPTDDAYQQEPTAADVAAIESAAPEVDEMEREVRSIISAAEALKPGETEAYKALRTRAEALPQGSAERKRVVAALTVAHKVVKSSPAAEAGAAR